MQLTDIATALEQDLCMFYSNKVDIQTLRPEQTLPGLVECVNVSIEDYGKNLKDWPNGFQNEAARLVRANWIYQNLATEPIKKPILVNQTFGVVCGDTRLMALSLLDQPPSVSVILTCPQDQAYNFKHWQPIISNQDLISAVGFSNTAKILITKENNTITWFEIGDASTSHHLHDRDQRIEMMQRYIDQQADNFLFSVNWCKNKINWYELLSN